MPDDGLYRKVLARIEAESGGDANALVKEILREAMAREMAADAKEKASAENDRNAETAKAAAEAALLKVSETGAKVEAMVAEHARSVQSFDDQIAALREALANTPKSDVATPTDLSPVMAALARIEKAKTPTPVSAPQTAREYVIDVRRDGSDNVRQLIVKPK